MIKLYNVLSQTVEPFEPYAEAVTIYVCGITPYDTTHLGHAFTYTSFDILIRFLERQGYTVRYAQNVTDIDDDILRKAKEVNDTWNQLGNRWTTLFMEDLQQLNVRPPDFFPRATDVIADIITSVQKLLGTGVAYESGGNVYFHINSWPTFGKLSRLPYTEMLPIANQRGNNPNDPHKRDPLDFVLWQAQAPGEPAWESPWGPGRPGWHIECSTMSTKFLGHVDIHGGGGDLVFPHHECEIAQAEPLLDGSTPFTRFWLHVAMVYHDGEKMSKSLGNLVMVRKLLEQGYSPDGLRLHLGGHHYRQIWSYSEPELKQSEQLAQKLREAVVVSGGTGAALDPTSTQTAFDQALANDLDTPTALTTLNTLADDIVTAAHQGRQVQAAQRCLHDLGHVFGLRLSATQPETRVITGWNEHLKRFKNFN